MVDERVPVGVIGAVIRRYERFLRIDERLRPWDQMRARAVYIVMSLFVGLQIINLFGMAHTYGGWSSDHYASSFAIVMFLLFGQLLRYTKNFGLFVCLFGGSSLLAMLSSSITSGVHTALLPFVVVCPIIAAFIGNWRMCLITSALAFALLVFLMFVSTTSGVPIPEGTAQRTEQRFMQANFALILCTGISAFLSHACQKALEDSEEAWRRAEQSARAKSDFMAVMSHELRTPMNGMLGLTEALLSQSPGSLNERQAQLLSHVRGSGEHLLALLNDLLDLSKIEAGKIKLDPRVFDIHQLLASTRETFAETATGKGLSLKVDVDDALPACVMGDDQRVRQILNNLVSNALKFTDEGEVTITVEALRTPMVRFRVTDTGRGVPDALRDTIFQPFEQGERGTTRDFGGTGLGLSISRQLTLLLGGTIELEKSEAGATTFAFSLPLPEVQKPLAASSPKGLMPGGFQNVRVLVAEDNPVNSMVLTEFLKAWGARATFAVDGEEALEMFDSGAFDILLVDRRMPKLDGEGVVRAIRARDDARARTPIIAVTADAMDTDRDAMLAIGVDGFVSKPLRPDALKAEMLRLLLRSPAAPSLKGQTDSEMAG